MNDDAREISHRLGLRAPQARSLDILAQVMELAPPDAKRDLSVSLARVRDAFPSVTDFQRDFLSVCFALATGVGKTRLMGAFIAYLYQVHAIRNFFVVAPNLTIYDKLIRDFTPNTEKYVFKGLEDFRRMPPMLVNGESFERHIASGGQLFPVTINVFNIAKFNTEIRGGRMPRIRGFRETLGSSYFDYLAGLGDLVLIMDESHRYRASAGVRALNELKPMLGLELTATPFTEKAGGTERFANVIYDYPLAAAIADGFVKEPAVVTREDFTTAGKSADSIESDKLQDGLRLHERVKVELAAYAAQTGRARVKPIVLVIARDITHASALNAMIASPSFFGGRYNGKTLQVDSRGGEDDMVARLLRIESADDPTEIVIHVNMLKEGWDVVNLYTIIPLRAANARTLIVQSIGRGARLPYGQRTGVTPVDRLNIVAHDRFQEILDEARSAESPVRLQGLVLTAGELDRDMVMVESPSRLDLWRRGGSVELPSPAGGMREATSPFTGIDGGLADAVFSAAEQRLLQTPRRLACLRRPDMVDDIVSEIATSGGVGASPRAVLDALETIEALTIAIPDVRFGPSSGNWTYQPFQLDASVFEGAPAENVLRAVHLRTGQVDRIGTLEQLGPKGSAEERIVDALRAFVDVDCQTYDGLFHDLARQAADLIAQQFHGVDPHSYLDAHCVSLANRIHEQMQEHTTVVSNSPATVSVTGSALSLRPRIFERDGRSPPLDLTSTPADKSHIARYLFTGLARGLYAEEVFHSDTERLLALILDRDARKWFRPARGQFPLVYLSAQGEREYQPDFVAETEEAIFMIEAKAANEMRSPETLAKRDAALLWCKHANEFLLARGDKLWRYLLIPHDAVSESRTLAGLAARYQEKMPA